MGRSISSEGHRFTIVLSPRVGVQFRAGIAFFHGICAASLGQLSCLLTVCL